MKNKYYEQIHRANWLMTDLDALYHQAALKLGVSDSVLIVLYMIHEKGDQCLVYDICKGSGVSKQTINSASRKLENDGILYLEQDKGRTKRVCLTEKGKPYVERIAGRLLEAESNVFNDWEEQEIRQFMEYAVRYTEAFSKEIEKL